MWIIVLSVAFLSLLALGWWLHRDAQKTIDPQTMRDLQRQFCEIEGDGLGGPITDANYTEAGQYIKVTCGLLHRLPWRKRRQLIKQLGDQWWSE